MRPIRMLLVAALALDPRPVLPQAGVPLGPEFRVNTFTTSTQENTSVAPFSSGFVVVWASNVQDGSSFGVFGQRYAGGGAPLGPEFRVNTYTTGGQRNPSVDADPSGGFVVVWDAFGQDGSSDGVFGQRYLSSGAPVGPEFRVNTYTTNAQLYPAVASLSGGFVVVWMSPQDGSGYSIFAQRYAATGAVLGPEFRVNTYTTGVQARTVVAADPSGTFLVTWGSFGQDGSDWGVFGQRYGATGAPLGPEFRVNTYVTSAQLRPAMDVDGLGNFVVVWESLGQDLGGSFGVFGQRYTGSGAPLGPEFRVNTFVAGDQRYPSVAADGTGNFVGVWTRTSLGTIGFEIFGQRYSNAGGAVGPEFRVNTYTTGHQRSHSVAAEPSGNFVVAWHSDLQDGSLAGVFGQRYGPIVPVELMRFGVE